MRIRSYILVVALCLPAAAHSALAQPRQTPVAQAANAAQQKSPDSKLGPDQPDSNKGKSASKPATVFTNDNLNSAENGKAQAQPGTQSPAQPDPKSSSKHVAAASNQAKQQSAAKTAPARPKIELDPHKVLTNDDLGKLNRQGANVVGNAVDLSGIYDCDINCYNQVRQSAQVYPSSDLDWMRDLRSGIEKLKLDDEWRAYLVRLADLRSKICTLADEEKTALKREDNENNVTDQQINIREQYSRKLQDVNDDITAEYGRMNSMQAKYSPLVSRFMYMQVLRIMTTNCPSSQSGDYDTDSDSLTQ